MVSILLWQIVMTMILFLSLCDANYGTKLMSATPEPVTFGFNSTHVGSCDVIGDVFKHDETLNDLTAGTTGTFVLGGRTNSLWLLSEKPYSDHQQCFERLVPFVWVGLIDDYKDDPNIPGWFFFEGLFYSPIDQAKYFANYVSAIVPGPESQDKTEIKTTTNPAPPYPLGLSFKQFLVVLEMKNVLTQKVEKHLLLKLKQDAITKIWSVVQYSILPNGYKITMKSIHWYALGSEPIVYFHEEPVFKVYFKLSMAGTTPILNEWQFKHEQGSKWGVKALKCVTNYRIDNTTPFLYCIFGGDLHDNTVAKNPNPFLATMQAESLDLTANNRFFSFKMKTGPTKDWNSPFTFIEPCFFFSIDEIVYERDEEVFWAISVPRTTDGLTTFTVSNWNRVFLLYKIDAKGDYAALTPKKYFTTNPLNSFYCYEPVHVYAVNFGYSSFSFMFLKMAVVKNINYTGDTIEEGSFHLWFLRTNTASKSDAYSNKTDLTPNFGKVNEGTIFSLRLFVGAEFEKQNIRCATNSYAQGDFIILQSSIPLAISNVYDDSSQKIKSWPNKMDTCMVQAVDTEVMYAKLVGIQPLNEFSCCYANTSLPKDFLRSWNFMYGVNAINKYYSSSGLQTSANIFFAVHIPLLSAVTPLDALAPNQSLTFWGFVKGGSTKTTESIPTNQFAPTTQLISQENTNGNILASPNTPWLDCMTQQIFTKTTAPEIVNKVIVTTVEGTQTLSLQSFSKNVSFAVNMDGHVGAIVCQELNVCPKCLAYLRFASQSVGTSDLPSKMTFPMFNNGSSLLARVIRNSLPQNSKQHFVFQFKSSALWKLSNEIVNPRIWATGNDDSNLYYPDCLPYCKGSDFVLKHSSNSSKCFFPVNKLVPITDSDLITGTPLANEIACPTQTCSDSSCLLMQVVAPNTTFVLERDVVNDMPLIYDFRDHLKFVAPAVPAWVFHQQMGIFNDTKSMAFLNYSKVLTLLPDKRWNLSVAHDTANNEILTDITFLYMLAANIIPNAISNSHPQLSSSSSSTFNLRLSTVNCTTLSQVPINVTNTTSQISQILAQFHPACQIYDSSFEITQISDNIESYSQSLYLDLQNHMLNLNQSVPNDLVFGLKAVSSKGVMQIFQLRVQLPDLNKGVVSIANTLLNNVPYFEKIPITALTFNMKKELDGTVVNGNSPSLIEDNGQTQSQVIQWKNDGTFEIQSPSVIDLDNDALTFLLDKVPKTGWFWFVKLQNKFKIVVNKNFMKTNFTDTFTVSFTDNKSPSSKASAKVQITLNLAEWSISEIKRAIDEKNNKTLVLKGNQTNNASIAIVDDEIQKAQIELETLNQISSGVGANEKQSMMQKKEEEIIKFQNYKTLLKAGGSFIPGKGVTFPNVTIPKEVKQEEIIERPKLKIEPLSQSGVLTMKFSQDMLKPNKPVQDFYNQVLSIAVENNQYGSKKRSFGYFSENSRKLEEENDPLAFKLKVIDHSSRQIQIQLDYLHPETISREGGMDSLVIQVLQPELFLSDGLNPLDIENSDIDVTKTQPPLLEEKTQKTITVATRLSSITTAGVASSNFFVNLLMSASMQHLWGMLRTIQMIVYIALIKIDLPPMVFMLFQCCMILGSFDILDASPIYRLLFSFQKTAPLNENFQFFSFGDKIFLTNSCSFFPANLVVIISTLNTLFWQKLALRFSHNKFWRWVGLQTYKPHLKKTLTYSLKKTLFEMYLTLLLCLLLNVMAFLLDSSNFGDAWNTFGNIVNSSLVIIYLGIVAWFPFWILYVLVSNYRKGTMEKVKDEQEFLVENSKTSTFPRALYSAFFIFRRLVMGLTLVLLIGWSYGQCFILIALTLSTACYLIHSRPLLEGNSTEIFNEITTYIVTLLMTNFLNVEQSIMLSDLTSWAVIGIITANLAINLLLTVFDSLRMTLPKMLAYYSELKFSRLQIEIRENREHIIKKCPAQIDHYKNIIEEEDAIKFVKWWRPYREWLRVNNVDFKEYPEEVEYQEKIVKFNLIEKANQQRLAQCIEKIIRNNTFESIERRKLKKRINLYKDKDLIEKIIFLPSEVKSDAAEEEEEIGSEKALIKETSNESAEKQESDEEKDKAGDFSSKVDFVTKPKKMWSNITRKIITPMAEKSRLAQMMTIQEESKETDQSMDLNTKGKQEIYKLEKDKVEKNFKLANYMNIKQNVYMEGLEARKLAHQQIEGIGDRHIYRNLKNLVELETNMQHESHKRENPASEFEDITFLIEEDFDEATKKLAQQIGSKTLPPMEQFELSSGHFVLKPNTENGFMQAVMQVMLRVGAYASAFMKQRINNMKPIREAIYQMFMQANCQQLELVKIDTQLVSLQPLLDLKLYDGKDAAEFLKALLEGLLKELQMMPKTRNLISFEIRNVYNCDQNHRKEKEASSVAFFEIQKGSTVSDFLKQMQETEVVKKSCSQKKCKSRKRAITTELTSLPNVMVAILSFGSKGRVKYPKEINFPLELELSSVGKDSDSEDEEKLEETKKYSLTGIVAVEGSKLLESAQYSAIVQRKNQSDEIKWFKIQKDAREEVEFEEVMSQGTMAAQILVYECIQQSSD